MLFFLASVQLSEAQTRMEISGRVFDSQTREPLPGATIIFGRERGIVADNQGMYRLLLDYGTHTLVFRYVGYKARTHIVEAGAEVTLDVFLDPDVTEMQQVVVSAGRIEQRISDLTVSVALIRPEAIAAAHITSPQELLNKTSGVEVLDGQASIRGGSGFSYGAGSRVMALVDGLPMLSADAGSIRWRSLPFENIARVEIIKGASSVLYGSSALNGIINFRMAEATTEGHSGFMAESSVFGSPGNRDWKWWDTPRSTFAASFSHLKKYGHTDIGISTFLLADQGYRKRNDEYFGRLSLRLTRHHARVQGLAYGLNLSTGLTRKQDFILWENAWEGALIQDVSTASDLNGRFLYLDPHIQYRKSDKSGHTLRARIQLYDNSFPVTIQNNSQSFSVFSEYQANYGISPRTGITGGVSHYANRIVSLFYGNHQGQNLAAYAQGEFNPADRIRLVAGMRVEYNVLDGQADKVVPLFRAGINYRASGLTFLRASWGQGYRFPSVAEKHASTSLGAVRVFPNPMLLPESGWNAELGIKQGIAGGAWNGLADLALFYGENQSLIEYVFGVYPEGLGFRSDNIEHSRVYGFELEGRANRKSGLWDHSIAWGYVFMQPVEFNPLTGQNTGRYLKFRRRHAASLGYQLGYGSFGMDVALVYRSRMLDIDQVFLNPQTREDILPGFYDYWMENNTGYVVADAGVSYRMASGYSISLMIKNISNTEYLGRPGDVQPHRQYSLRLSGNF